jgi:glycosyltransferase involved in cell wall biosynthesis
MSVRVLHIAHGVEYEQTGAGYAVPRMCCALAEQGVEVTLAALDLGGKVLDRVYETNNLEVKRFPYIGPRRIGYSPALRSFLTDAVEHVDIVQTHFLWSYPVALGARTALEKNKPLIILPRGALLQEALSESHLAKSIWFKLIDGPALKEANCVVATSEREGESVRNLLQPKRLAIIPEGVDFPNLPDKKISEQAALEIIGDSAIGKYLLYLGYLSPHKNLEKIIKVWSEIQKYWSSHTLIVAGPGRPSFIGRLRGLIQHLGLAERVKILPPVYGEGKWTLLNGAEAMILPSRSENFGFVVAEALYCGTPVVASRGYPWPCLETEAFGHWVEAENGVLAEAINDVLSWPPDRRQFMAQRSHLFIRNNFSWERVANQYIELYHELLY